MAQAQRLYQRLGFRDIERYNDNSSAGVRFMEQLPRSAVAIATPK
jgi:hypothetical protein